MTTPRPTPLATGTLTVALWLIAIATAGRIAYLLFLSPFELTADEAHYWEWSRHLDWSYYSKGPGIALLIRAATALFRTDAEWAIRMVPTISFAITAACMAILARRAAPDAPRAPLFAALLALLVPAFQGSAMLATIDAPFLATWAIALIAFQTLDTRLRAGRPIALTALAFGAAVGIGILIKYTMLLLPVGLIIFHLIDTPRAPARVRITGASIAIGAAAILASPIAIWNAQRGWPTVHHLLGHLGTIGSDVPGDAAEPWVFNPLSPLEFIGTQIALVGPVILLVALALLAFRRQRSALPTDIRRARALLVCAGLPVLALYLAVSFLTDTEGNWALPAYISLGVLAAIAAAGAFAHRSAPGASARRFLWNAGLIYGLIVAIGIPALPILERIPSLADTVPLHRIIGGRADAQAVIDQIDRDHPGATAEALVIADRYTTASLMAYYFHRILGDAAPLTTSASGLLGDRPSTYDFWAATDPRNPALFGRDAILIGSGAAKWDRFILFDAIEPPTAEAPFKVGRGYRGPRPVPIESPNSAPDAAP